MKINTLETHDRLLEFKKQSDLIAKGCQDCINNRPKSFENHPFYIFAHKRTIELDEKERSYQKDFHRSLLDPGYVRKYKRIEDVPSARIIWQPRLTKPKAEENSMLFKAYPPGDTLRVIWIIPDRELFSSSVKNKMLENKTVQESIYNFKFHKDKLEAKEDDDLPDHIINKIYEGINQQESDPYLDLFNSNEFKLKI